MNEEYIKEYEEMSLYDFADELVEPLFTIKQDLTKTIYIHYAKERDKNEQLQQEKQVLQNRIDKAIKFIEKNSKQCLTNKIDEQPTKVIGKFMWHIDDLLDILKESGE